MALLEPDNNDKDFSQQKLNIELELTRIDEIISSQKGALSMEKYFALQTVVNTLGRLINITPAPGQKSTGYIRVKECELRLYQKRMEQIITQLYVEKELMSKAIKGL